MKSILYSRFNNGLTVAELKRIISDWSEINEDGEPCKVWLGDGRGLSNEVKEVTPLNLRRSEDGTKKWADIILLHDTE